MKTITRTKTTLASLTAGLALVASPAFADRPPNPGGDHGKATAPGQLCKSESHKKTNHGKGKSPFAACVVGATRAQREAAQQQDTDTKTAPSELCKDQSHKRSAADKAAHRKSPFAACVSGAAKAQND
jgi:hypothetical protein